MVQDHINRKEYMKTKQTIEYNGKSIKLPFEIHELDLDKQGYRTAKGSWQVRY